MFATVQGVYRDGQIVLSEVPQYLGNDVPVFVTFLNPTHVSLIDRGISPREAHELRANLSTFAEDWDNPSMAIYDEYETWENENPAR